MCQNCRHCAPPVHLPNLCVKTTEAARHVTTYRPQVCNHPESCACDRRQRRDSLLLWAMFGLLVAILAVLIVTPTFEYELPLWGKNPTLTSNITPTAFLTPLLTPAPTPSVTPSPVAVGAGVSLRRVYLRAGPGMEQSVIGVLEQGARVNVIGCDTLQCDWYQLAGGQWVAADCIRIYFPLL